MTTEHQTWSPGVDLDHLDFLHAEATSGLGSVAGKMKRFENFSFALMNQWGAISAELRTLRARVAEFEMPDAEADRILTMSDEELDAEIRAVGIDPAEIDKRASHVAKWAAECSKLRARVGELESGRALDDAFLGALPPGNWLKAAISDYGLIVNLLHRGLSGPAITQVRRLKERAESAEARVAELEKLFDDAGQGERNVLALIDHYQSEAMAESEARRAALARVGELECAEAELESQLAAAREGKARLDAERTRLVFEGFTYADVFRLREESELEAKVREVLGERFDHLNARRCIVNGETEWFADTRNIWPRHSFVSAPTLPALLRAILEVENKS